MAENIIDSFYNNEPKQEEVNQPKEDLNSSQEDNLESVKNSENQGENQKQGEKDQQETEPPAVEKKDWSKTNEFKGFIDEREKRKKLEEKVRELESKILQPKQEEVKKPDALDDPEGAINYSQGKMKQQLWAQKVELSESIIKSMEDKYPDYDKKRDEFMDLVKNDPRLGEDLRNAPNPALFAYNAVQAHEKKLKFSNPDYEKELREQLTKEILEEMSKKQQSNSSNPIVNTVSLSNTTGSKNIKNNQSSGNSLEGLFQGHHFGVK